MKNCWTCEYNRPDKDESRLWRRGDGMAVCTLDGLSNFDCSATLAELDFEGMPSHDAPDCGGYVHSNTELCGHCGGTGIVTKDSIDDSEVTMIYNQMMEYLYSDDSKEELKSGALMGGPRNDWKKNEE